MISAGINVLKQAAHQSIVSGYDEGIISEEVTDGNKQEFEKKINNTAIGEKNKLIEASVDKEGIKGLIQVKDKTTNEIEKIITFDLLTGESKTIDIKEMILNLDLKAISETTGLAMPFLVGGLALSQVDGPAPVMDTLVVLALAGVLTLRQNPNSLTLLNDSLNFIAGFAKSSLPIEIQILVNGVEGGIYLAKKKSPDRWLKPGAPGSPENPIPFRKAPGGPEWEPPKRPRPGMERWYVLYKVLEFVSEHLQHIKK